MPVTQNGQGKRGNRVSAFEEGQAVDVFKLRETVRGTIVNPDYQGDGRFVIVNVPSQVWKDGRLQSLPLDSLVHVDQVTAVDA